MNQGLSIVIPALNEEENIPKLLEQLDHYFVSYDCWLHFFETEGNTW